MGNIEQLNAVLGRLLNGYMNAVEEQTHNEWTDPLDIIREDLNVIRSKGRVDGDPYNYKFKQPTDAVPKFKIGDLVY